MFLAFMLRGGGDGSPEAWEALELIPVPPDRSSPTPALLLPGSADAGKPSALCSEVWFVRGRRRVIPRAVM